MSGSNSSNNTTVINNHEMFISFTAMISTSLLMILSLGYCRVYSKHRQLEKRISVETYGIPVKDFSSITPVIGEMKMVLKPMEYQDENHPKYGDIYATMFMNEVYIVMKGPELLDQLYLENAKNIKFEWNASLMKLFGDHAISQMTGDEHKRYRRLILNYVGMPSLNRLFPGFVQIFNKYVISWIEKTKDGSYIDITPELGRAIWEAISFVIIGDDISKNVVDELGEIMVQFGYGVFALPVNLPFTTFGKALKARKRFREIILAEYDRRQKMHDKGYNRKDFLQTLINETCNDGYEDGFNLDAAISVIWASLDTTKGATLRMVNTMIDHAKEWGKVRNDLRNAFGTEGVLAPDVAYSRLVEETPYVSACVKEIMRYNGTGLLGMRKVANDIEIVSKGKKYKIPAGYKTYASIYYHHRDPESPSFSDPTSFIPERYMGDDADDKVSKFKGAHMPFGLGERQCPGNPLARLELEILMSLMSNYKWTRRERVKEWRSSPAAVPVGGLWIRGVPLD